eukprot:CAMPEP_0118928718 /NCGR_PEP_ID=MMETSP1169-20130426/5911_1 /TAXON_ID=36882 /ORGANISM="Pyramimonas obovata, Strain CCMP722" /LENGTH=54 /DNA_ID=CAMNT_0006870763 /DNA_START=358 /DNA_END=520 /DNA_ORIENTATION=+
MTRAGSDDGGVLGVQHGDVGVVQLVVGSVAALIVASYADDAVRGVMMGVSSVYN